MPIIKNFDQLAISKERKDILTIMESGLRSIQPEEVLGKNVYIKEQTLYIQDKHFNLEAYDRVFILGFGKGASKNAFLLENTLGNYLTDGYVIDNVEATETLPFKKIKFTLGSHPVSSPENFAFTSKVVDFFTSNQLTEKDLVIIVICGGGSAMFEKPHTFTFEQRTNVDKALLKSGANITEMNIVRKHLSAVKGGGLAKTLYPATIATLIFSDVPGNNLSTIASGPTVKDETTVADAEAVLTKYNLIDLLGIQKGDLKETPKEDMYFKTVYNILMISNGTALLNMEGIAMQLGYKPRIYSDKFQSEARLAAKELIAQTQPGEMLLVGGETTVKVKGNGIGGRNQEVVLGALIELPENVIITSFGSDGWDNSSYAGAIGDQQTIMKARTMQLDLLSYLDSNNSQEFFKSVGDGIDTGKLSSNVSDLMIVLKK